MQSDPLEWRQYVAEIKVIKTTPEITMEEKQNETSWTEWTCVEYFYLNLKFDATDQLPKHLNESVTYVYIFINT